MRLIDADAENGKLLDFIAEHDIDIQYALEHKDMAMLEDIFFEYFEAQQAAYDVDRVVGQFEESRNIQYRQDGSMLSARRDISIDTAIEIVKAGVNT